MRVGKYTYGHENIHIEFANQANLIIGNYCSIAEKITVFLGGNHRHDWITTFPFGTIHQMSFPYKATGHPSTNGDVIIGNDVWIGYGSTIMSGVKIGDGAVIAAGSHIVKNIEDYSIVGGNPGKHIKFRFDIEKIRKLQSLKWWYWHEFHINKCLDILSSGNIDNLEKYYNTNIKNDRPKK